MSAARPAAPFHLLRWFAGLGALVIALIGVANAWVVSNFLTGQLLLREAEVSREFVQNVLTADDSLGYLSDPESVALRQRFIGSIEHFTNLKGVLRANVYGRDRRILWSSDAQLIGRGFTANSELERAMAGELVVHGGHLSEDEEHKGEHEGLSPKVAYFVETYIPVQARPGAAVDGVVELYKAPLALTAAIREGQRRVAWAAFGGALALYLSLFWLVARADRTLRRQQFQLREAETAAAMSELAASVAHNIRNPLASIRSSAELSLDARGTEAREHAADILHQVDRISSRIDELLRLAGAGEGATPQPVDLVPLLRGCVADHQASFGQRGQRLLFDDQSAHALVRTDPQLLTQVMGSLLANASEAMAPGQACTVQLAAGPQGRLQVEVRDDGPGLTPAQQGQVFRPFFTTKPQGLGLGLALAQRIVQRLGGRISLHSQPGQGTAVRIDLPRA